MENWKKKVILFLSSQAISLFGSSLVQFAIIWYITLETKSGLMMTFATLCGLIPQVIISLFAGVWADRYNKKKLIIYSDAMIAIATGIITTLFFFGINNIFLLFVVLVIRSLGSGIQTPTTTSFIPEIVPENQLMRVNGIQTTAQSVMLILSPAISGALLTHISLEYIFLIDVITAIIGITIFSFVKINYQKKAKEKVPYLKSIYEGISYTKNHKFISRSLIFLVIFNFLMTPCAVLTPLYVTRVFGADAWYLTFNEMVFFIGNIVGSILISVWGGFSNRIRTIGVGCLFCGIFSILIGFPVSFIFYLIFMGLMGVTMPFFNTPFITLFQEHVDADKQGRVFSLITILTGSIMPIGMMLYGPLADLISIEWILIVTGVLFVITTLFLLKDRILHDGGKTISIKKEENIL